jgi:peptide/nickel transport system permease protein
MLTNEDSVSRIVRKRRFGEAEIIVHVLRSDPLSIVALAVIVILILIAVFAPFIAPSGTDYIFLPPSLSHPFGTDGLGRDLFIRVLLGARISLMVGILVVALSLLIGCPLGVIAGYFKGTLIDEAIMRITDMFLALPPLLLAIAIATTLGYSLTNAMIAIAISWWPWYTRLMRAQAVSLRERPFVEAAKGLGVGEIKIVFRHILPNSLAPIIVQATMDIGSAILLTSGLSFLGLGAQPPTPEWGLMVNQGRSYLGSFWWYATFPGLAIFITVMAFNLLGDGLRKALDPRLRIKRRLL